MNKFFKEKLKHRTSVFMLKKKFCLFYNKLSNVKSWVDTEQLLKKKNLKYFQPLNSVSIFILSSSKFLLKKNLFFSSVLLMSLKKKKRLMFFNLHNCLKLTQILKFLSLKFFNKFYYEVQLKSLVSLNYYYNIIKIIQIFYTTTKYFYFKFSK